MNLVPGTLVDRYKVEAEIGRGGMARVFRVRHKNLDTVHALKVLTLKSEELNQRLMREGKLQSQLDHPNIVPVRDVLELDEGPGLLMDYIEGSSLDSWLLDNHPDAAECERLFLEIVAGVDFAHQKGVVHRDLKPGNVMMETKHGRTTPRVADFGLAKLVQPDDEGQLQSRTGRPMGTPAYMAPEQVRSAKHVDNRADVFALGCILYELMCGRRAFIGNDSLEVFNRVTQGNFLPPRQAAEGLEPRFEQAIFGALAVNLEDRIPDCTTLVAVLEGRQTWTIPDRATETFFPGAEPIHIDHNATTAPLTVGLDEPEPAPEPEPPQAADPGTAPVKTMAVTADHEPEPTQGGSGIYVLAGVVFVVAAGLLIAITSLKGVKPPAKDPPPPTTAAATPPEPPAPPPVQAEPPEPPPPPPEPEPQGEAEPPTPPPAAAPKVTAPAGPPGHLGRVKVSGDAKAVSLRGEGGTVQQAGDIPPGSYLIQADFGEGLFHAGNLVVLAGKTHTIDCRAATLGCAE